MNITRDLFRGSKLPGNMSNVRRVELLVLAGLLGQGGQRDGGGSGNERSLLL